MPITNAQYTIAPSLQQCFINPNTGVALASGTVEFFRNTDRLTQKSVYKYTGTPAPAFIALPNPVILNGSGCFDDIIYYLPFDQDGNIDLYYIVIKDSLGTLITTIENWPQFSETSAGFLIDSSSNFIENSQFLFHGPDQLIIQDETPLAPPFWNFRLSDGFTSTNNISFERFDIPADDLESYPRYAVRVAVTSPNPAETEKFLYFSFPDVNIFAGQEITYQFEGISNTGIDTNVQLVMFKNYGTGGSPTDEIILQTFVISDTYNKFNFPFMVPDNNLVTIGSNDDDSLEIGLRLPTNTTSDTSYTNFIIILGNQSNITFPVTSKYQATYQSLASAIDIPAYDNSDIGKSLVLGTSSQNGIEHIGLIWGSVSSDENFIPTGNFSNNLFQRGTSFAGLTGGAKLGVADRFTFQISPTVTAAVTVAKDTDAPSFSLSDYVTLNSISITTTTAQTSPNANDSMLFGFCIEGHDYARLAGNDFTLSFYVKSNVVGIFSVSFLNEGGDRAFVSEFTINNANTYENKSISVSVPPLDGTWNYGSERGLRVIFSSMPVATPNQATMLNTWYSPIVRPLASANQVNLCASNGNYIKFSLISLKPGLGVNKFSEPSMTEIVSHCLRYHEQTYNYGIKGGTHPASVVYINYIPNNGGAGTYATIQYSISMTSEKRIGSNNLSSSNLSFYAETDGTLGMWDVGSGQASVTGNVNTSTNFSVTLTGTLNYGDKVIGHWIVDTEFSLI
jgi:hypothetical protein